MHATAVDQITATAPYPLPPLPYDENALDPFISGKTLSFHYGKHHQKYVTKTNSMVEDSPYREHTLEHIVSASAGKSEQRKLFNNAAQAWNHWFFWNSMTPGGGGQPTGAIARAIDSSFGGFEQFAEQFTEAATTQFGSGWAWLVKDSDSLRVMSTPNADNPITLGLKPLLTLDVWEHAYYLDYQNRRPDYVKAFIGHLINWEFADDNMNE